MRVTAVTQRSGIRNSNWVLSILVCHTMETETYFLERGFELFLFFVIWEFYPLKPKRPKTGY